jgi:hypothetical protein
MVATGLLETAWLWALVVGLAWALVTFFAERQQAWPALIVISLTLIGFGWWGSLDLLGNVVRHPLAAVAGIGLYLAGGTLWSLTRWWLFATAQRGQLNELLLDWLQARGFPDRVMVPPDLVDAWRDHLQEQWAAGLAAPPSFSAHRRRILSWMLFWPFSMVWTAVQELLVETARWLVLRLRLVYVRIAAWVYRDVPGWFAPASPATDPSPPAARLALPSVAGWGSPAEDADRTAQ